MHLVSAIHPPHLIGWAGSWLAFDTDITHSKHLLNFYRLASFHCESNSETYFINHFGKGIESNIGNIGNESQYRSFIGSYKKYRKNRKYRRSGRPAMVIKKKLCHFYSEKWAEKSLLAAIFNSRFQPIFFSYGMSWYLAIFIPNMKTIGPILWPPWWSTGKIITFSSKMSPWWPSWIYDF